MKTKLVFLAMFAMIALTVNAQSDYENFLQNARQRLAEGDCLRAEMSYNVYTEMARKTNKEVERLIEECKNGGSNAQGDEQSSVSGSANGHDYVDLGLPSGTMWATCNVGASKPEDCGNYYAWGETSTKSTYKWDTYKYANGYDGKLTKYCNNSEYGHNGFNDSLTILQSEDDPATANWGDGWETPSKAQWEELLANTTKQWMTQNGVAGYLFTSKKNGQTIFLPNVKGREDYSRDEPVVVHLWSGLYWSKSLCTGREAWCLVEDDKGYHLYPVHRDYGFSVRPVRKKSPIKLTIESTTFEIRICR